MHEKIAVVDVGSNSVRLMLLADGKILYKRTAITRLGEGLSTSGRLQPSAIDRTIAQIAEFLWTARTDGATKFFAYATAAVRGATNGNEFVETVKKACDVCLEVLSGEEEARIGLVGALGDEDGVLLDIGGGSTELIVRRGGKIVYSKSIDVGVVRLKDLCGEDKQALARFCAERVKEYDFEKGLKDSHVYAVGGTATTLAAWTLRLERYDGEVVTGSRFTLGQIKTLIDELFLLSTAEIACNSCVGEKRAQVIKGGALWLGVVLDYIGAEAVIVSDNDNLDGYAKTRGLI